MMKINGRRVYDHLDYRYYITDTAPDLELEIAHYGVREVHEGRYHNGEAAVVQVLARKG